MKRSRLIFTALLLPIDALMILGAFILAWWLRTQIEYTYIMPFGDYLKFILWILPLWLATLATQGLYRIRLTKSLWREIMAIFISSAAGITFIVFWIFLSRQFFFSRLVIFYVWGLSFLFLVIGRLIIESIQRWLYLYDIGQSRILIVGKLKPAETLIVGIQKNPVLGYKIVGLVSSIKPKWKLVRYLGKMQDLSRIIKLAEPDELILTDPNVSSRKLNKIIFLCREHKLIFKTIPGPLLFASKNIEVDTLFGIPLIELKETSLEGWGRILKRVFDLVFGVVFLILGLPFMLLTTLLVGLTSRGPIIYAHEREGHLGIFKLYKFRTMKLKYCVGKEYGGKKAEWLENKLIKKLSIRPGPVPKIKKDPRLILLGNFLRRTSLDELPQFFNVLLGQMSLVGPRPHLPKEVAKYKKEHRKLLIIKPGITGLAQISGRSDLNFNDEARLDIYYIENWSLWLDIQIILKTPAAVLKRKGAY